MLKIVEVHAAERAQGEYLVLQNQGLVSVSLRGWALCTEAFLEGDPERIVDAMYVFREETAIKPYTRVVLFTGTGEDGWVPTIDGRQAYCAFWNRAKCVWREASNIHLLHLSATRPVQPVACTTALSA